MESTADVLCAVLLGNVSVVEVDSGLAAGTVASIPPTPAHPHALAADGSVAVRFAFQSTEVSSSACSAQWHTCNATSSSPNCLQLYQAALSDVVLCSNDPQYLTVSSSGTSLDFSYAVSACLHRPVCVGGGMTT